MNTVELMRNHLAELIYSEATIEGVGVTTEQVRRLLEGNPSSELAEWQIQTLENLRLAWDCLFDKHEQYVDLNMLLMYNYHIQRSLNNEAGRLRDGTVFVDTHYGRYYPGRATPHAIMQSINQSWDYSGRSHALALLALVAKGQFFSDGNKRTAQLVANHELARMDLGSCFCVPVGQVDAFKHVLGEYYMNVIDLDEAVRQLEQYLVRF